MKLNIGAMLIVAALVVVAAARLFGMSGAIASDDDNKAAIVALENRLTAAENKMDAKAAMAFYMDDALFFYATVPFQFKGAKPVLKAMDDFYREMRVTEFHASVEALSVEVSGNLAAAHFISPSEWSDKHGKHFERLRCTQIFKKVSGQWLIWHEHISVPFDPVTGKAVLDAGPSKG